MAPWTFDVKFSYGTQFIFGSLMFVAGKDGNFKMLPSGSAPERLAPVHGQGSCFSVISSTSGGACSGLNPYAVLYIRTKLVRGIPVVTSIHQPSAGASSSSLSAASLDQDSADDYLEIGGGAVPVGTPLRATLSSWWPWSEDLRTTAPADIPPSGD
jgi:hypothetical protein